MKWKKLSEEKPTQDSKIIYCHQYKGGSLEIDFCTFFIRSDGTYYLDDTFNCHWVYESEIGLPEIFKQYYDEDIAKRARLYNAEFKKWRECLYS